MRVPLGGDGPETARTYKVKSSDRVTTYWVQCLPGGLWTCTCNGFVHRGKCRHIKLVRSRFAEDAPVAGDLL